ncbi:MAG: hypothetical protein ACI8PZ_000005 [Myxococcota bacterium]
MVGCSYAGLTKASYIDEFCSFWDAECPAEFEERYEDFDGCRTMLERKDAGCSECRFTPRPAQACLDALPTMDCNAVGAYGNNPACSSGFTDCGGCDD